MAITGLKSLREFREKQEAASNRYPEREKVDYVQFPKPRKPGAPVTIKVRFLQELDDEATGYSEKNGTAKYTLEHNGPGPQGFKRRAECTVEDGGCIVCERRKQANDEGTEEWKNWKKASVRMYLNAAYVNEDGKEVVGVYGGPAFGQNIFETLTQYAEDKGTITNRVWSITKSGEGTDTKYIALPGDPEEFDKSVEDYELWDLENAYLKIPYENQARFYESAPGWDPKRGSGEKTEEPKDEKPSRGFKDW